MKVVYIVNILVHNLHYFPLLKTSGNANYSTEPLFYAFVDVQFETNLF